MLAFVRIRQCLLAISILNFFLSHSLSFFKLLCVFVCDLNLLYNFVVKRLLTAFCPSLCCSFFVRALLFARPFWLFFAFFVYFVRQTLPVYPMLLYSSATNIELCASNANKKPYRKCYFLKSDLAILCILNGIGIHFSVRSTQHIQQQIYWFGTKYHFSPYFCRQPIHPSGSQRIKMLLVFVSLHRWAAVHKQSGC